MNHFVVKKKSRFSPARAAELKTKHGSIKTPFFMPVATLGAVKTLSTVELKKLGAQIVLANTYHLMLRPGEDKVKKSGGLHEFMNWPGPILTDSGGFQVFSLAKIRKIKDTGVEFCSPLDGKKHMLTPEKSLKIQQKLGVDIAMVLDECVGYPARREDIEKAVERTTSWARKSKIQQTDRSPALAGDSQLRFAINQGGIYKDLRIKSAQALVSLNFDGYAIGGLAVGEPWTKALKVLNWVIPELSEDKPRYLMGVGYPEQIIQAVEQGIDMFDCVIPTREARHGKLYVYSPPVIARSKATKQPRHLQDVLGRQGFYQTLNLTNSKFSRDLAPISKNSKIPELRQYSKAYLHHLFKIKEPLAQRLATLNNVEFYLDLMEKIRSQIKQGEL